MILSSLVCLKIFITFRLQIRIGCTLSDSVAVDTANWLYVYMGNINSICHDSAYVMPASVYLGQHLYSPTDSDYNYKFLWSPAQNFVNDTILNAVLVKQLPLDFYNDTLTVKYKNCKADTVVEISYFSMTGVSLPPVDSISRGRHEIIPIIGGIGSYQQYYWSGNINWVMENSTDSRKPYRQYPGAGYLYFSWFNL